MYSHGLIAPVVVLIIWSLLVLVWLYATRIPAMAQAKVDPEKVKDGGAPFDLLPVGARRVAANYNHLMEQPTLFYALCFALQFLGEPSAFVIGVGWTYVALRVLHSLVQNTVNVIMVRFTIFMASSIALGVLAYYAAMAIDIVHWF